MHSKQRPTVGLHDSPSISDLDPLVYLHLGYLWALSSVFFIIADLLILRLFCRWSIVSPARVWEWLL